MPFVSGFLKIRRRGGIDNTLPGGGEGPIDPDYGIDEGGHPDQGLPGFGGGGGLHPDQGLPRPPPGVWPPLTPSHPIQPAPPGTPPGAIWPPIGGVDPGYGLPEGPRPGQGLPPIAPPAPGAPDQGLPPAGARPPPAPGQGLPKPQVYWVVCGIPGVGWRYTAVDPSLVVGHPLPPVPQPK
jgi:hypothetical protein